MLTQHKKRMIYAAIGIFIFILLYALKNTNYFMRASSFIFAIALFYFIDYFFDLNFKNHHYLIFIVVSALGILLSPFYFLYPNYDKVLHLVSPILLSILIFFLINKVKINFSTKLMITFAFMISLLALFEILEYAIDQFFDFKLQGVFLRSREGLEKFNIITDKNDDTMIDLILGTIGSLLFIVIKTGAFYYKKYSRKLHKLLR